MQGKSRYITIKEAAKLLGVSTLTLRNWDRAGKLRANRHPLNNYRVYRVEDIMKVIENIEAGVNDETLSTKRANTKRAVRRLSVKHLEDQTD